MLDDTVRALRRPSRKVVRLAAGPIFTACWLMPRSTDLWERHPGIELEVAPSYQPRMDDHVHADIIIGWERLADMPGNAIKLLDYILSPLPARGILTNMGQFKHPGIY